MNFEGVRGLLQKLIGMDFIEKLIALSGKKVNVQIKHLLYGNQKLNKCVLRPFVDEERIGLIMDDGEEKYIMFDELCEASIKSEVMKLYIIL